MCITTPYIGRFSAIKGLFVDLLTTYSTLIHSNRLSIEGQSRVFKYADIVNTVITELNSFMESFKINNKQILCSNTRLLKDTVRSLSIELADDYSALNLKSHLFILLENLRELENTCCAEKLSLLSE